MASECIECRQYTRVAPCAQCGQVIVCPKCINGRAARFHAENICFSITAPTSLPERAAAWAVGGMGPVHQWITMRAWQLVANAPDRAPALAAWDPRQLVAGVIYNDFPTTADEIDADGAYVRALVPIAPTDAPYITDARFLLQPSDNMRWAVGAVYKRIPERLLTSVGIPAATVAQAAALLTLRTQDARVAYHFMRRSHAESDAAVCRRAAAVAAGWFRDAVIGHTLFPLGHVWHMVQDSFSPAHTRRVLVRTDDAPYGLLQEVYFFGDQNDRWHSSRESWAAVSTPGSEADQRVSVALLALRDILAHFLDAVAAAPTLLPAAPGSPSPVQPPPALVQHARQAADAFEEFMLARVFRM